MCTNILRWAMDNSVYAPSQWEAMLHCNVISHWLRAWKIPCEQYLITKWGIEVTNAACAHTPARWCLLYGHCKTLALFLFKKLSRACKIITKLYPHIYDTYIGVSELDHCRFMKWPAVLSHYLNQCRIIVNGTPGNKLKLNLSCDT